MSGSNDETDTVAPPVERVLGPGIPVRGDDIDTDQIIPARFLKVLTFEGLGRYVFYDQRFTDDEQHKDHPFNDHRFQGANVLVVNANFGCGSSREHAPQALRRWGIDAIVGESFAEIFAGNCLALGVPTVTAPSDHVEALQSWIEANPSKELAVDVAEATVTYGDTSLSVGIDETQRTALLEGVWDTTAVLRANAEATRQVAEELPYVDRP